VRIGDKQMQAVPVPPVTKIFAIVFSSSFSVTIFPGPLNKRARAGFSLLKSLSRRLPQR
jgi:hypothetical protein